MPHASRSDVAFGLRTSKSWDSCRGDTDSSLLDDIGGQVPMRPTNFDLPIYAPVVDEMQVSPIVSRRGYLNFMEGASDRWVRKYVVRVTRCCLQPVPVIIHPTLYVFVSLFLCYCCMSPYGVPNERRTTCLSKCFYTCLSPSLSACLYSCLST